MISAPAAFECLVHGNQRFVNGESEHDSFAEARAPLIDGQEPFACVLSCADSRVPPELLFDVGLGDLFVVRVAGNISTTGVVGSVEYAVQHLGVRLVVVLGHQGCGAVDATVMGYRPDNDIRHIVDKIAPAVRGLKGIAAVKANALAVAASLRVEPPILAEASKADQVQIVAAVYHLETGRVAFL